MEEDFVYITVFEYIQNSRKEKKISKILTFPYTLCFIGDIFLFIYVYDNYHFRSSCQSVAFSIGIVVSNHGSQMTDTKKRARNHRFLQRKNRQNPRSCRDNVEKYS